MPQDFEWIYDVSLSSLDEHFANINIFPHLLDFTPIWYIYHLFILAKETTNVMASIWANGANAYSKSMPIYVETIMSLVLLFV